MKKFAAFLVLCVFSSLFIFAKGDDNWFMAQTKKATISSITATSELIEAQYEGKYIYPPVNIVDGKFENTWCESVQDGPGIGESITIELSKPLSFDEIQIVNGFAYKDYYKKNNRVKDIQITQVAKKHFQQKTYTLKDDTPDWQSINFEYTQTAQTITFKIVSVYKGAKYDDTCLDDIRFLYKGKVIPFENVDKIKKEQEENSKLMLQNDSGSFKDQFLALATQKEDKTYELVLLADNKKDALYITLKDEEIKRYSKALYFPAGTSFSKMEKEVNENDLYLSSGDFKDKKGPFIVFLNYWSWSRSVDYTLGNYRIIKDETIDYVTTTTSMLIKFDGKSSIYINGVHYNIINGDNLEKIETNDGL